MISTTNLQEAKNKIKKSKRPIIVLAKSLEFNRKILEYGKFDILLSIEKSEQKDKSKKLASGLNHILAKIASKNKISIGIDIKEISELSSKQKAIRISRIKQNIKICEKVNCKIKLLNYKDGKNAKNFLLSIGISTTQTKLILT